jgi:hypothetical protein
MHLGRGERPPAAVSGAGYRDVARRPLLWQIKVKSWKRLEIAGDTYTNIHERHCAETRHNSATCTLRTGTVGKADIDLPHRPAQMSMHVVAERIVLASPSCLAAGAYTSSLVLKERDLGTRGQNNGIARLHAVLGGILIRWNHLLSWQARDRRSLAAVTCTCSFQEYFPSINCEQKSFFRRVSRDRVAA